MKKAGFITGAIFLGIGALILFTLVVMWLWNWLMPEIFNLGTISFLQAAGILVLAKILFSGTGHGQRWHSERKKKFWHSKFEEKWRRIPEEKKEAFAKKMEEKGFERNGDEQD